MADAHFVCPDCEAQNGLTITHTIQVGSDSRSDEINLQLIHCSSCSMQGAAIYEESRRGALDEECWDHDGFHLEADDYNRLMSLILACPQPGQVGCHCHSHQKLAQRDHSGRWRGLEPFRPYAMFFMKVAKPEL